MIHRSPLLKSGLVSSSETSPTVHRGSGFLVYRTIILASIFFFCNLASSFASPVEIDLQALASIESSNNPNAVSFLGAKYGRGLYQVSEIALADYLQYHPKEKITPDDLFNPAINERIAVWLLNVRIPQILKHIKRPVTLETVLSAYNKGYSKDLAFNYIKKYRRAVK